MTGRKSGIALALAVLILAQIWLISGSFDRYFNHDSLFYLIHAPDDREDLLRLFVHPDAALQYRPLSVAFMGLFTPFFGLNPEPYHWIPILFHILNTWLFYRLAGRLLSGPLAALTAAIFWGLHSVAGWITYDVTFLSDFLQAFFLLCSLILCVDGHRSGSRLRLLLSLIFFACALLTKEAAVTFPLAVFLCLVLSGKPSYKENGWRLLPSAGWKSMLPYLALIGAMTLAYVALLFHWFQSGVLYTQGPTAAYDINPWTNLARKTKYLFWGLNLPDALQIDHPNRNRALALLLMGGLLLMWAYDLAKRKLRPAGVEIAGFLWFAGLCLPALMLSHRLAKWYLYVPVMGIAFILGSAAPRMSDRLAPLAGRLSAPLVVAIFMVTTLFSSHVQTKSFLNSSDTAYASRVMKNLLEDFRRIESAVPENAILYLLPTFEKNVADLFGYGKLYELHYPDRNLRMLFADKNDPLPADYLQRKDVRILQYLYGHVYDVTDSHKQRVRDSSAKRLITSLENVQASVNRDEFYFSYESFETPGGTPVFFPTPQKEIFSQIGGSSCQVPLDDIPGGAVIRFDISWMHEDGDGGWAELRIRAAGKEEVLFREYMNPNPRDEGIQWKEVTLSLDKYAGHDAELILRCYNSVGKTTVADWLNWRDLVLEVPEPNKS